MLKALGWLWTVVSSLLELVLLAAVVAAGESRFESVVLSGGVLTYLAVVGRHASMWLLMADVDTLNARRFIELAELLNNAKQAEVLDVHRAALEKVQQNRMKVLVASGFRAVALVIAIIGLIAALAR